MLVSDIIRELGYEFDHLADAVADDAASDGVELLAKPFTIADAAGALAGALG